MGPAFWFQIWFKVVILVHTSGHLDSNGTISNLLHKKVVLLKESAGFCGKYEVLRTKKRERERERERKIEKDRGKD